MATWLKNRPEVTQLLHPAFETCPGHKIWKRDFSGSSGLFSFIIKKVQSEKVENMLNNFQYFKMGFSWGGFESLILQSDPAKIRSAMKWRNPGLLFRIHIGQEDVKDLINDLKIGFDRLSGKE